MGRKQRPLSVKPERLPARFRAGFPWTLNANLAEGRIVAAELMTLWQDLGGRDNLSSQQRNLCERGVYLTTRLRAHESLVLDGKPGIFEPNEYSAALNSLIGVFKQLGMARRAKDAGDLRAYLADQETLAGEVVPASPAEVPHGD